MTQYPLEGLNVIELHAIGPVPFAGMLLQQLGARVTRICPPQDRGIGIAMDIDADLLNHGKPVIRLNLKDPADRGELDRMLAGTDVLMEGFRAGVMERLALSPDSLLEKYDKLIIGRLSGFGRTGPLASQAGHDINYLALSGALAAIGTKERPVVPLNLIADFGGGAMYLLTGILAKLVSRSLHGKGGVVDTSILAGTLGLTTMMQGLVAGDQWVLERQQNLLDGAPPFYRVYKTRDQRFVAVGALEPKFFCALLELTGLADQIDTRDQYQRDQWDSMSDLFAAAFATRSRDDWARAALDYDCCVSPVLNFIEAAQHPHATANHWFSDDGVKKPEHLWQFT